MSIGVNVGLVLRPWCESDVEAVLAAFATDDMDQQWREPIRDAAQAREWLTWTTGLSNRQTGFAFAVTGPDDVPVGNIAVTNINQHDCGWLSYWIAASARGSGVASDSVRGLVSWLHDELGLHRLELGYRVNNPGSAKVAAKAGFVSEGIQREKLRYGTRRFDVERCARLATDYRSPPVRQVLVKPLG